MEIFERDAGLVEVGEKVGYIHPPRLGVVSVDQLAAIGGQFQPVAGESGRDLFQPVVQLQRQLFAAEFAHQLVLVFDQDDLTVVDHPDSVGHLLGLVDVVGGQHDGHVILAKVAHHLPHILPQLHIDARRRLVEKQDSRFVREGLGDHDSTLHAAGERHDLVVLLVPQGEVPEYFLDVARVWRLAEQTPAETDRGPDGLEGVGRQFLGDESDQGPRRPKLGDDVVTFGLDDAFRRIDDPAHDVDQRGLPCTVGTEQGEDLSPPDLQVDLLERPETRVVGLIQVGDGDDGLQDQALRASRWSRPTRPEPPGQPDDPCVTNSGSTSLVSDLPTRKQLLCRWLPCPYTRKDTRPPRRSKVRFFTTYLRTGKTEVAPMGLAFGLGVHTEVLPCMSHSRESGNPRRPHGLYVEPCPDGRCAEFWTAPRGETARHAPVARLRATRS